MITINTLSELLAVPISERKFCYIDERVTSTMPIEDSGEALVDLGNYFSEAGIRIELASVSPAPYNNPMYLRLGAAQRLVRAATQLQQYHEHYSFKVTDSFRPLELQKKYFEEIKQQIAQKEQLEGEALWKRVTQFIADPDLCPPHSTGGAIDLTIVNTTTNTEIDMGTPVDTIDDRANTWTEHITREQKINRTLLFDVMTEAGFVNLASEWWHYSYGDGYWAAFYEQEAALYGSVESFPNT